MPLTLFVSQHMHWLFPAKDKTQKGDVFQRKAEWVLTIDLRHYANQHRQDHFSQEPEQQTLSSERGSTHS